MSNVTALPRETRPIEAPVVEGIPLADLYLSDMNPRQEADPEGIALLADSIALIGLIQPIAGFRDTAGRVGVVAGGRRWRAIRLALERDPALAAERPDLALVPVRLAPDEATARAWAAVENTAREGLHPSDEIRAYGRMREGGADVPTIARTFGVTEAHVYRRLALAALPAPVLDALKAGEITLGAAKAFTVAEDEALTLTVLDQIRGRETSEHRIRQMLQPEAINAASDRRARFVGLDAYRAAGGKATADLLAEATLLHDADLLDRLFAEKLQAEAEARHVEWAWVETLDEAYVPYGRTEKLAWLYRVEGDLTEEQADRYDELAELAEAEVLDEDGQAELDALQAILDGDFTDEQRRFGGWFLCVGQDGMIRMDGPYVRPEDRTAAITAEVLTGHAARQIENPRPTHRNRPGPPHWSRTCRPCGAPPCKAHCSTGPNRRWTCRPSPSPNAGAGRWPSAWRKAPPPLPQKPALLLIRAARPRRRRGGRQRGRGPSLRRLPGQGQKHRNAVLALALARSLKYSDRDPIFAKVEAETRASLRQVWVPNAENFFGRVSADTLGGLMLELTGTDPQGAGFKAFRSQKKAAKALSLEKLFSDPDHQRVWSIDAEKKARIEAWVPDWF